ncbi:MAG TPA: hypothetical protein VL945_00260 [Candidatus Saccharimonadales bacterium]|nr:hypothetical protein [Candidatus Saccharimonadales bacterium]
MDFWSAYEKRSREAGFGSAQVLLNTGERYNASLSRLQGRSLELELGRAVFQDWDPKRRYLIAKNLDFDLFVSFYDVNTKAMMAMRLSEPIEKKELQTASEALGDLKKPNLELRVIGLQNGDVSLVPSVRKVKEIARATLVEVDLFGNQTRHLIVDLLTGKPYSLLLENRIYRPGELITTSKKEDFEMVKRKLSFA